MNRDVQSLSNDQLAALRLNYTRAGLTETEAASDPLLQFQRWLSDALSAGLREPNAMTLATVDETGAPDARIVLLKGCASDGFVFFTNYESAKGRQLARDPRATLVFFWNELERQVRISGRVERISRSETEAYFRSRPRDSQLGAWTSEQSRVIADRAWLEARFQQWQQTYPDQVPLPPTWGGFRLAPETMEFWQGRPNRLHDRLRYRRDGDAWIRERLSP